MLCLSLIVAISAPPAFDTLPAPKFATVQADYSRIPVPKFGDEKVEEKKPAKEVKTMPVVAKGSKPYIDPPGTHRHRCDYDGTIWSHQTGGSHNCPTCGRLQYYHYTGPNPPSYNR